MHLIRPQSDAKLIIKALSMMKSNIIMLLHGQYTYVNLS